MINKIGLGNFIGFIGTYLANKIDLINFNILISRIGEHSFVQNWMDFMFVLSATGSALYIILKITKFIKNWDKYPTKKK